MLLHCSTKRFAEPVGGKTSSERGGEPRCKSYQTPKVMNNCSAFGRKKSDE